MHNEVQSDQTQKLVRGEFEVASVTDVYNLHEKPEEELKVSGLDNNKHTKTGPQSLEVKIEETATHQLLHHATQYDQIQHPRLQHALRTVALRDEEQSF